MLKLPKLKNYKHVAALSRALKKALDKINLYKVRDIHTTAPHQIKTVVKNGGGCIE